jgi:hypothetical protein
MGALDRRDLQSCHSGLVNPDATPPRRPLYKQRPVRSGGGGSDGGYRCRTVEGNNMCSRANKRRHSTVHGYKNQCSVYTILRCCNNKTTTLDPTAGRQFHIHGTAGGSWTDMHVARGIWDDDERGCVCVCVMMRLRGLLHSKQSWCVGERQRERERGRERLP